MTSSGRAHLQSAVRLNATARYLGVLVGPAVGGVIMLWLGPTLGIIVNTIFYLPMLLWLFVAPRRKEIAAASRVAMRGFADILATVRIVAKQPILISMICLAALTSFLVGNAYHAQMPGFAIDLGHGDPGLSYSMLLAADALGAMVAGVALETWSRMRARAGTAIVLATLWSAALLGFAADQKLSDRAGDAARRRLFRTVLQCDGADAGAAERAAGKPRAALSACSTWLRSACAPSAD